MKHCQLGGHERQLLLLSLLGPVPLLLVVVTLGNRHGPPTDLAWLCIGGSVTIWLWAALAVRAKVAKSLTSLSVLLAALRQGDLSVRGRDQDRRDTLNTVVMEFNRLAQMLADRQADSLEATALLTKVLAEIDVAVFAFDRSQQLRLVNRAGERLIGSLSSVALGSSAVDLGLASLLEGLTPRTVDMGFASSSGQWELRRSTLRIAGRPHHLVVLSDLRRALREEERQTWQRVIRVLGHELNNSLAPIRSIAADLQSVLRTPAGTRPLDFEEDLVTGLAIIDRRAAALDRFMTSYARLAKLPPPRIGRVEVSSWIRRVVELEQRLAVTLGGGPSLTIPGDGDQLDQLLINLVRNGVDAAVETNGGVEVTWRTLENQLEITVADEGLGVANTHNLFVPFFTTKPNGTGVGLVLSRQICEAHGGSLSLESRSECRGALARLRLPLCEPQSQS